MPAVTLSFSEVVDRLQILRRRLNTFAVVGACANAGSVALLALAVLFALAPRTSAATFRIATWTALTLFFAAAAVAAVDVRRRLLDLAGAARVADRRGALADRLTTLASLPAEQHGARLVPLLLAQTLARSGQWDAARVLPRRLPASVYLLAAAACLLLVMAAPRFTGGAATARRKPSAFGAPSSPGDVSAAGARVAGGVPAVPAPDATGPANDQEAPAGTIVAAVSKPADSAPTTQEQGLLASLPDRLQRALTGAAGGATSGAAQRLATEGESDNATAMAVGPGGAGRGDDDGRAKNNPASRRGNDPNTTARGDSDTAAGNAGASDRGDPQRRPESARSDSRAEAQPPSNGPAPPAGSGSRPGGVLAKDGRSEAVRDDRAREPFEIRLTSFLGAEPGAAKGRDGEKESVREAASRDPRPELNSRQAVDDLLRRAQVPAEYEELLRRVYLAKVKP